MSQPILNSGKAGLPEISSAKFPPEPFDKAQDAMKVWDAWYSGDTERLYEYYSSDRAPTRPVQYSSGFRGRIARFFWGRPSEQATKRLHVPAPADLARTSADLLFSQPPRFVFGEGDSSNHAPAQDRLEKLLGSPEAAATLMEAGELQAALGGAYLRMWWDTEVSDKVEFSGVSADCAVPEWRYGRLIAVTFWTIVHKDKRGTYRHLERHSPGSIEHGLYFGTDNALGTKVDLREMPETAWAADIADDGRIATGVKGLTAAYAPNVRPNRMWRNEPGLAALGRSDFDGLEELFDALDHTYSSWMRDLDLGKGRIFVDDAMLTAKGPGKGVQFDLDQEVFTALRGSGALKDGGGIDVNQFEIRWNEHSQTAAELLNAILRGAGYSAANFADDSLTVTKTATEIESRDRLSERTRDKKIGYWKAALQPFAETMLEIDKNVFKGDYSFSEPPEVRFPIRPQQNPQALATSLSALRASNLISIEQAVRQQNPNWSGDDVNDEVDRIHEDMETEAKLAMGPDPNADPNATDDYGSGDGYSDGGEDTGDQQPEEPDDTEGDAED